MKKLGLRISLCLLSGLGFFMFCNVKSDAAMSDTQKRMVISSVGRYFNWDGVSNVAQFKGPDGTLYYAIDSKSVVTVYKTNGGKPSAEAAVNLKKIHPAFGTVTCDSAGNYYLVTGETNSSDNTSIETIFISKYDRNGNHIKTTGDNGSSSIDWYYDGGFYTKEPFSAGNCDAAINGKVLSVMYARLMYNGHQSCSVFSVNIDDMSKVNLGYFYESHSFAQRVVSTSDGFSYMSEGDAYDRTFTSYNVKFDEDGLSDSKEAGTFDFWIKNGESENMGVVNNNFAHMGGIAALSDDRIAFAAQSARSLNANAGTEKEDIFIQIFDPFKDLHAADAYTTIGERSGKGGLYGTRDVTNYGVQWLTSLGSDEEVEDVQIVTTDNKEIVVLYEYSKGGSYQGVYYIVMDEDGKEKRRSIYNAYAMLNPCVMPICTQGKICWVGNKYGDEGEDSPVYIYSLDINSATTSIVFEPLTASGLVYNGSEQELITPGIAEGGWLHYAVTTEKTAPKDSEYSAAVPAKTNAGNYYIWYKGVGDANHAGTEAACVEVKIEKAESRITREPGIDEWPITYSGTPTELFYYGCEAEGGTVKYAVTKDGNEPGDFAYKEGVPEAVDAGKYYVWYKVMEDENYKGTEAVCVTVQIDKAPSDILEYPQVRSWTMKSNGKAQKLIKPGEAEGGTMYYAVTSKTTTPADKEFKTSVPTAVNSGTYYVWYKIKGDKNHKDTAADYIEVSIAKGKDIEENSREVTPAQKGKSLTDKKTKARYVVTSGSKKNPTVKYTGSTNTKAASVTVPATVKIGGVTYKVTEISARAFKGNKTLKSAKLGKNITKIGDEAFYGCTALEALTIPAKTAAVGKQFVGKCTKLKTLTFKSTKLTKKTLSNGACKSIGKKVTIKVPRSKVTAYTKLFRSKGLGKKVKVKAGK